MKKTNMKKILAILTISSLAINSVNAVQIGTWSVSWTTSYDAVINWDGNTPWVASGSITWLAITASVLPILNMVISTWSIDLWILSSVSYSTWSLDVEVGTNAWMWVNITAQSGTGWLRSASANAIINDQTTDWLAESYRFASALNAASDSAVSGFSQTANLSAEVNNNTTSHILYSTNKPESSSWVNDVTFYVSAKNRWTNSSWYWLPR